MVVPGFLWTREASTSPPREPDRLLESQEQVEGKGLSQAQRMSRPSDAPRLTPQYCFNERALRGQCFFSDLKPRNPDWSSPLRVDFLRLSRGMIDDSIVQNLNALVTPSRQGFSPLSTAERQIRTSSTSLIDEQSCQSFKEEILFQSWQIRSDVLNYCAGVALDPLDPDLVLRQIESAKDRERVVDERLDPYSGRFFPREVRTESLANLIRNERSIENIIRTRTWRLVSERCGDSRNWDDALNQWRLSRERPRSDRIWQVDFWAFSGLIPYANLYFVYGLYPKNSAR